MARLLRIDEIDPISVAGVNWRPIRRPLGITAFGINAYSADAGEHLIEEHDETGHGAGRHEELYVVISGHATFVVDGEKLDAPAGTLVFLDDPTERRAAVAVTDATVALAIGGNAGAITPSAWEHYFAAAAAVKDGDYARAYEIAADGLEDHADNPSMHFNLACYASLGGETDTALEHLARAIELDPKVREWAATDSDFDAIRQDPRFPS